MRCWNVAAVIETAGGAAQLRRLLARAGEDVPDNAAISMWKQRNRIPSQWTAPILFVILSDKPAVRVVDLMTQPVASDIDLFADEETAP